MKTPVNEYYFKRYFVVREPDIRFSVGSFMMFVRPHSVFYGLYRPETETGF